MDYRRFGQPLRLTASGRDRDTLEVLGPLPERMRLHLDCGYGSEATHEKLKAHAFSPEICEKGKPALLQNGKRWVVERTNSWHNAHNSLLKNAPVPACDP